MKPEEFFRYEDDDEDYYEDSYDDKCYECTGYGDDYYEDENGNLVCACDNCPYNGMDPEERDYWD